MVTRVLQPSVELLRAVKLLAPFSDEELGQLLSLSEGKNFEPYSNIIIEGELSWGIFVILSGVVGIYKNTELSEAGYDVGHLESGNVFGEMSLIDENPRSATVRALTPVSTLYISKDKFNTFLQQQTDRKFRFFESCISTLVRRLRDLDENYVVSQYQLWKSALSKSDEEAA